MNTSLNTIPAYAFAAAGEQAFDWAYDMIAKHRPGGANDRRLRALQAAGEALKERPELYAAAPKLLTALVDLLEQATGPAMVYGDGRGNGGKKTGLSHWEFNKLRQARIDQANNLINQLKGEA